MAGNRLKFIGRVVGNNFETAMRTIVIFPELMRDVVVRGVRSSFKQGNSPRCGPRGTASCNSRSTTLLFLRHFHVTSHKIFVKSSQTHPQRLPDRK